MHESRYGVLGEMVLGEMVLGEMVLGEMVLGEMVLGEMVLGRNGFVTGPVMACPYTLLGKMVWKDGYGFMVSRKMVLGEMILGDEVFFIYGFGKRFFYFRAVEVCGAFLVGMYGRYLVYSGC